VLLDEGRGTPKDPASAAEFLLRAVTADSGATIEELTKSSKNWSADTIRAVQQRLQQAGYYQGSLDGRNGPKLRPSLQRWRSEGIFLKNG
ncbi:peptidoglycan-binding domain-containing protein, partial [uncultured Bosea sp.]|uniref:peptidoglycan-binding domain-containing protein n=1 Tax=uncultured Bosea sp. TaxID=211457 RepID=UPI0025CE8E45